MFYCHGAKGFMASALPWKATLALVAAPLSLRSANARQHAARMRACTQQPVVCKMRLLGS